MDEILKRVHAKFAALSSEELKATLEKVADHPLVKVFEAILDDDECWHDYESFDVFSKIPNHVFGLGCSVHIKYDAMGFDFFVANDPDFLLAA
ncbi:hypothetical protein [Sphaerotilus uruguayifluvii]|uniref:Uncharacterized protein n=1 Tax=Sphaerotilus uruguayifluvii TaxID=2735897 RepID=A0ABX2G8E6_9BURK|nr:hypothetical protein [Leptothrix sp. C29]NRT58603.1 hypothetical protein [Leptothrix sp. C29]